MKYWLITDTHFNHNNLIKWGVRKEGYEDEMWDSLESIPKTDSLIHLGDVCMGNDSLVHRMISNLSCQRILVRGNHDKNTLTWYLDHGWDFVVDTLGLEYMGETILMSHRPLPADMWRYTMNIHGHTHGNLHRSEEYYEVYSGGYHIDISPELVGNKALTLETIIKNKNKYARPEKDRYNH